MPYPYRAILDAGVCAGLSWGMGLGLKRFDASKANLEHIAANFDGLPQVPLSSFMPSLLPLERHQILTRSSPKCEI